VVVKAEGISKYFRLHTDKSDSLKLAFLRGLRRSPSKTFCALKDVSFQVKQGTTLGIVGENGSGKSTLLKILTKVYTPTEGSISVEGKVSGLLELGAGFHPELTGRENIYLNGSILGLKKKDMDEIFEEIVDFSELRDFIDTPVKHYSSGMFIRLGFAVAINVNPDIFVIDEVLAVGDEHFQRKCNEKILQFKRQNKTIIIVSHALEELRTLCDEAIWLEHGKSMKAGAAGEVIDAYLDAVNVDENAAVEERAENQEKKFGNRWGSYEAEITKVEFLAGDGNKKRLFKNGEPLIARIHYKAHQKIEKPVFGLAIHRSDGVHVTGPNTRQFGLSIPSIEGEGFIDYRIDNLGLLKGSYLFSAALYDNSCTHAYDHQDEKYFFEVASGKNNETYGFVSLNGNWSMNDKH